MPFNLINETNSKLPPLPFEEMKNASLGKSYSLNLIFIDSARVKQLNTIYRDKECPTDILSFPVSETEGDIYISEEDARAESVRFGREYDNFIGFLFIHGCTHLKGHDHGAIMEGIEAKLRKRFGV